QQRGYLKGLTQQIIQCVDANGKEVLPETRFLDWSTAENKDAIHAGLQALLYWALNCAENLLHELNESDLANQCSKTRTQMKNYNLPEHQSKQSHALAVIAGLEDPVKVNEECFKKDPLSGLSTFYGFYVLQARAMAGDLSGGLDLIKNYWGPMLKMGATTFWEHFDTHWLDENPVPIDEIVPDGRKSIHRDFGEHCYIGLRHSLCHGWASGPTTWLMQHILGVQSIAPSWKKVKITPYLGESLNFAEGTVPTPFGIISVRHEKDKEGKIRTQFKAPKEVEIIIANKK
ncbi:MAG TPA: alpha-L-rhamnosidase C-terminal domain-containing protein, partial [Candidatus Hydrogenedens sp.]|nr:alpha-L-rhamnosidase C-terminal domain-containing protein [Candidatus Hydrogenedens sp.]